MTGALLDRPGSLFADPAGRPSGGEQPGRGELPMAGGRLTLEERLTATLHAACTNGSTECPVCHARMRSTRAGAECGGCGSRLS
jgi:hypothetical protein